MNSLSVTVAVPVYNEESRLTDCLEAIAAQTYDRIAEVLVVDGGSTDATRAIALSFAGTRVLDNRDRIQAAALNIALKAAVGDIFVRVDGHSLIAVDYVERCVTALTTTGAAMVGGGMTPAAETPVQRGIAAAMSSSLGAGPARFHVGGTEGWVDTVYLGAYFTAVGLATGGYDPDLVVNEDAEFAIRMGRQGGVWYDPAIRSTYSPRSSYRALSRQFFRYGWGRASTIIRHPCSLAPRQLAPLVLVLGLASSWRKRIAIAYGLTVSIGVVSRPDTREVKAHLFAVALPVMHFSWAAGFLARLGRLWVPGIVRLASKAIR